MIENYFNKLSKTLENCKVNIVHEKVSSSPGAKIHISYYELFYTYKDHQIELVYELGGHNLASVEANLKNSNIPSFSTSNKSHFSRLFSSKGNILKVDCKNIQFKKFIEEILTSTGLEQIARDNLFEPRIETKINKTEVKLVTGFYLGFEDKSAVILPLLNFYKHLIDFR